MLVVGLNLFLELFCFSANANGSSFKQSFSKDTVLQSLIDIKLIPQKSTKKIEAYLQKIEKPNRVTYLDILFYYEFSKITGYPIFTGLGYIGFGSVKPSTEAQNKTNMELLLYLQKVRDCKLINDKEQAANIEKIQRNEYVSVLQLLHTLKLEAEYSDWLNKSDLLTYADELFENGILTETSFNALKKEIEQDKIDSVYKIIPFCKNAKLVNLAAYSNDPAIYLEQLYKDISMLLPGLAFSNFSYKIVADTSTDLDLNLAQISVTINGVNYKQSTRIKLIEAEQSDSYLGKIDRREFYTLFNKVLIEMESPKRLHLLEQNGIFGLIPNYTIWGIIVLEKNQMEMFHRLDGFLDIGKRAYLKASYENFNNFSRSVISKSIDEFQKLGLFKNLSEDEIKAAKEEVFEKEVYSAQDILLAFPNVVYVFDVELGNIDSPYTELLREFSKISNSEFLPYAISDAFNIEKEIALIRFSFNGKTYSKKLTVDDDWIDTEFLLFISNVLAENKVNGNFYYFKSNDQLASVIFLNKSQYEYVIANKLLDLNPMSTE